MLKRTQEHKLRSYRDKRFIKLSKTNARLNALNCFALHLKCSSKAALKAIVVSDLASSDAV